MDTSRKKWYPTYLISILILTDLWSDPILVAAKVDEMSETSSMSAQANIQLAIVQGRIAATIRRAKPTTVRIAWGERECNVVSGVIISPDGYIVTQCQYPNPMRNAVAIYLADGRRVQGKVLGSCWAWDIRFLKISAKGSWPHAEFGKSTALKPGDLCLALGYPAVCTEPDPYQFDREPAPRVGRLLTSAAPWWLATSCRLSPGHMTDWGGGLFDLDGRLIGIHCQFRRGDNDYGSAMHVAVEVLQKYWAELTAENPADAAQPAAPGKVAGGSTGAAESKSRPNTIEEQLRTLIEKCSLATVGIGRDKPGETYVSGVIVSADGYIVTCGHHELPFGDEKAIYLCDGRVARGKVLAWNPFSDVGLMKMTQPGPWPYVKMGSSMSSKRGDLCLSIGHPGRRTPVFKKQHPALRLGFVIDASDEAGRFWTSCYVDSGDSGGGTFDLQGRLMGVQVGGGTQFGKVTTDCRGVELYRLQWDFLTSGIRLVMTRPSDVGAAATGFQRLTRSLSETVVEVRQGKEHRSLGTIVGSDGWILTKASALGDSVSCRLAGGRELPARVGRVSREHDLAMLKVEVRGLPKVNWSKRKEVPVGTLVASVGVRKEDAMAIGTIYRAAHPAPPEPGRLPVGKLRDVKGGVEIYDATELEAGFRLRGIHFPFQEGDVITHVENRPTPDSHALLELAKEFETTAPLVVAGDRVHVRVLRDRRPLELDFPLPSSSRASSNGAFTCASCRRSGFSSVLDSDMSIAVGSFGGPVIDDSGRVIGIVIAPSAYDGLVYLLPAAIAEKASKELKPR